MRRSLCGTFSGRVTVREQDARITRQTSRSSRAIMGGASGVRAMANPEHLAILRQGVKTWNRWRKQNPSVLPDLSEANLRRADLRGANLKKSILTKADLSHANIQGADFSYADLEEANLSHSVCGSRPRSFVCLLIAICLCLCFISVIPVNISLSHHIIILEFYIRASFFRAIGFILWWYNHDFRRSEADTLKKGTGLGLASQTVLFCITSKELILGQILFFAFSEALCFASIKILFLYFYSLHKILEHQIVDMTISFSVAIVMMGAFLPLLFSSSKILNAISMFCWCVFLYPFRSLQIYVDLLSYPQQVLVNFLGGTIFYKANLTRANLQNAFLFCANFLLSCVDQVYWKGSRNLQLSFVLFLHSDYDEQKYYLFKPEVRIMLMSGQAIGVNFNGMDLSNINLQGYNLSQSSFCRTNLGGANLGSTKFNESDLSEANLVDANLLEANLTQADLAEANLMSANLLEANLTQADLAEADLRDVNFTQANLTQANLSEANLMSANLLGANLTEADLAKADLRNADVSMANLTKANLFLSIAIDVNFEGATFTGACLYDWHINNETNFKDIICSYIYLKCNDRHFFDRRPRDPNKNFAPGEFAKLFQISFETIDLFFQEGVDWQAFTASFLNIRAENEDAEMEIQAIENTGDGILVKVRTTEKADKGAIEGNFWQGYEFARKELQSSHQARLSDKDSEINRLVRLFEEQRQDIKEKDRQIMELTRDLAKQPKYDQRNSNFAGGVADTNYGKMVETQNNSQGDTYNQSGNIGIGHNEGTIADDAKVGGIIDEERRSSEG